MKELSIEEKAKRYDEALGKARQLCAYPTSKPFISDLQDLFPELKESEDERIRKALISVLKSDFENDTTIHDISVGDIIAWLEKQGKQKSIDKAKLKFKIDDWVVFNNHHQSIYQVEKIEDGYYILRHTRGGTFRVCVLHDKSLRLWTLSDVKDGDVLAFSDDTIVIFKDLYNATTFHSYCHIENGTFDVSTDELPDWWEGEGFLPATKEQCEHLFTKMKEAGYKWNENKKELIKL